MENQKKTTDSFIEKGYTHFFVDKNVFSNDKQKNTYNKMIGDYDSKTLTSVLKLMSVGQKLLDKNKREGLIVPSKEIVTSKKEETQIRDLERIAEHPIIDSIEIKKDVARIKYSEYFYSMFDNSLKVPLKPFVEKTRTTKKIFFLMLREILEDNPLLVFDYACDDFLEMIKVNKAEHMTPEQVISGLLHFLRVDCEFKEGRIFFYNKKTDDEAEESMNNKEFNFAFNAINERNKRDYGLAGEVLESVEEKSDLKLKIENLTKELKDAEKIKKLMCQNYESIIQSLTQENAENKLELLKLQKEVRRLRKT